MRCLLPSVAVVAVLASRVLTMVVTYCGRHLLWPYLLRSSLTVVRLAHEVEPAAAAARLLRVEQAVSSGQLPRATPSTHHTVARCRLPRPRHTGRVHGDDGIAPVDPAHLRSLVLAGGLTCVSRSHFTLARLHEAHARLTALASLSHGMPSRRQRGHGRTSMHAVLALWQFLHACILGPSGWAVAFPSTPTMLLCLWRPAACRL